MGKDKLKKWAEIESFQHVVQPEFNEVFRKDYILKGNWSKNQFQNQNPIILELGCGKGEYTVGLARNFPDKNFIGVDIKGARIWRGAKTAREEDLSNVCFLRTRIEFIESFFGKDEIEEIWLTFPDPQLKINRIKKRLSGARFLNSYRSFLKQDGSIHLKTDNLELHQYTLALLEKNKLPVLYATSDLYAGALPNEFLSTKTYYEKKFLNQGIKITYLQFCLVGTREIKELKASS